MTRTTLRTSLFAALLGLLPTAFSTAHAAPATKAAPADLKVPPAPSEEVDARRAAMLAALAPELHDAFFAVVADTAKRLRASERAAAEDAGELLGVRDAARAALFEIDFAGISKRRGAAVDALVDLVVLQLGTVLHADVRDGIGRQRAIRAVRKCAGNVACLDTIVPNETMTGEHIDSIRKKFEGNAKELEAEDKLGNFEIQTLMSTYSRATKAQSDVTAKRDKALNNVLNNIRG